MRMVGLSRRGLLSGLAGVAAGRPTASNAPQAGGAPAGPSTGIYTNVRDFGAKGNARTDDTRAIQAAILAAPGGTVWFPPGTYLISKTLVLLPGSTYKGSNSQSSIIRQRAKSNLTAILADENFVRDRRRTTTGIQIEDLGIDGNAAGNSKGHGIVLMTDRCLVRHVFVANTPEAGLVLSDKTASGAIVRNNAIENRVESCTIAQPGTFGIWVLDTRSSGLQTDGYILNNVVKNSRGAFAMRIERAAGWWVANNHVYHCLRSGFFLGHATGTFFSSNEVDKFGLTRLPPGNYYGVQVQFEMARFRPSVFVGNLCATPEGSFPSNSYTYFELVGDKFGSSHLVLMGNMAHNDPIGSPPIIHHAAQSIAFAYNTQPGGTLNVTDIASTSDGVLTSQSIPAKSNVHLPSPSGRSPIPAAAAAGVAGGAVVAGLGIGALNRQARKQVGRELAAGHPAPSYRDSIAFIDVVETLNRSEVDVQNHRPDPGWINLTYFVPYRPIEVSEVAPATGEVAASGAMLSRAGLYEVLESGELRLLGATGNRADHLWTLPDSLTAVELEPDYGSVPLLLLAGKPYAYGEIQIGGSTGTRVGKAGNPTLMALEPRVSATYSGYTDLPSRLPPPSGSNASGLQLYARLSTPSAEDQAQPAWQDNERNPSRA
jgi:hypothetical protein